MSVAAWGLRPFSNSAVDPVAEKAGGPQSLGAKGEAIVFCCEPLATIGLNVDFTIRAQRFVPADSYTRGGRKNSPEPVRPVVTALILSLKVE